jgi:hypothetical protein
MNEQPRRFDETSSKTKSSRDDELVACVASLVSRVVVVYVLMCRDSFVLRLRRSYYDFGLTCRVSRELRVGMGVCGVSRTQYLSVSISFKWRERIQGRTKSARPAARAARTRPAQTSRTHRTTTCYVGTEAAPIQASHQMIIDSMATLGIQGIASEGSVSGHMSMSGRP